MEEPCRFCDGPRCLVMTLEEMTHLVSLPKNICIVIERENHVSISSSTKVTRVTKSRE